ncbi:TIGR02680 family protein [Enterococcus gilvus]|uniref:TIGR02680 family protein n=1 Tax=Enterococcus gilvus TaxID=160453 RepID=UPI003ED99EC4
MSKNKWQLNRAGLFNFWYYDNQIFHFSDGKLLLRGTNGSGKSVTMQSLLPVLLDGRTETKRLDSFGSTARRMEDYLLGEEEVSNQSERIGYLMLEYKKEGTEDYFTSGIGLSARRGGDLTKWYFVITDGSRIGMDGFDLVEQLGDDQFQPLTLKRLKNKVEVEGKGRVFTKQSEYAAFINQRIFGFQTGEQFDELIKLLIQLRSPKLSKDFKPTVIYDILTASLPPLKNDELQPLSQTINQIDTYRERLEQLDIEAQALEGLLKAYRPYRAEKIGQLAGTWLEKRASLKKAIDQHKTLTKELDKVKEALEENQTDYDTLTIRKEVVQRSLQQLELDDRFKLVEEEQRLKDMLAEKQIELHKNQEKLKKKERQIEEEQRLIDALALQITAIQKEQEEYVRSLFDYASAFAFEEETEEVKKQLNSPDVFAHLTYWRKSLREQKERLSNAKQLLVEIKKLRQKQQAADIEVGEQEQLVETQQKHVNHWQQLLVEELEKLREDIYQWKQYFSFETDSTHFVELIQNVESLGDTIQSFEQAKAPLYKIQQQIEADLSQQRHPLINHLRELQQQKDDYRAERKKWLEKQDPIPKRTQETLKNRQSLVEQKEIFYSFYETVDFLEQIPIEERHRIEAALAEMGLLDALVSVTELSIQSDRCLKSTGAIVLGETLADYLQPETLLPPEYQKLVMEILQEIQITPEPFDGRLTIDPAGRYTLAVLRGDAQSSYQASYIGKRSREEYRERKISELDQLIASVEEQLVVLKARLDQLEQQQQLLLAELAQFPTDTDFQSAKKELNASVVKLRGSEWKLQQVRLQLAELTQELKQNQFVFEKKLSDYYGDKTYEGLSHSIEAIGDYEYTLENIKINHKQLLNDQIRFSEKEKYKESLQEEHDGFFLDQGEIAQFLSKTEQLLNENNSQQELEDLEELSQELDRLKEEARELMTKEKELLDCKEDLIKSETRSEEALKLINQQEEALYWLEELWGKTYRAETLRFKEEQVTDFIEMAKEERRTPDSDKLSKVEENFENAYRRLENDLLEYRPVIRVEQSILEGERPSSNEAEYWRMMNNQKVVYLDIDGQFEDPFTVEDKIESQIEVTRLYLSQEDEQLFRQIIFDSVGRVLRQSIEKAQKWVTQMDRLLKDQGTENSSGLTLSLKWKPKDPEYKDELSTSRLITLLKKPVETLQDEDLLAIRNHFEEKINLAKELQVGEDGTDNLFETIKDILDYRNWFEFQLLFKKAGVSFKLMNNNQFFKFSGGEKAIAMYLPLFAAVYSRYQDAGENAPYIITLDEAFAGIDEKNITGLFEACEQLGFNYVMNSQSLRGEVSTVRSLNTYELIRPQNSPVVSVLCYHWNGKRQQLVIDE